MTLTRTTFQAVAFLLAALALPAQEPASPPAAAPGPVSQPAPRPVHHPRPKADPAAVNFDLVVLDPAHGGSDSGAELAGKLAEKDVTLALANTLRGLLTSRGFTVLLTRENSADEVSPDSRVELANRARPLACLLLHASPSGHGVRLFTSALTPLPAAPPSNVASTDDPGVMVPWDSAQAAALPQSQRLLSDLTASLTGLRAPLVTGRISVSPIDSLTCAAAAVEIAPLAGSGGAASAVSDPGYQQQVAEALAGALVFWRGHAQSAAAAAQAAAQAAAPAKPAIAPKPKPRPRPAPAGAEAPGTAPPAPPRSPAPIVRRPPPSAAPDPTPGGAR